MEIYILLQEDNTRFTFAVIVVESTLYTAAKTQREIKRLIGIICCNDKRKYKNKKKKIKNRRKKCIKSK